MGVSWSQVDRYGPYGLSCFIEELRNLKVEDPPTRGKRVTGDHYGLSVGKAHCPRKDTNASGHNLQVEGVCIDSDMV